MEDRLTPPKTPWRSELYRIIFEAETPAGKTFDVLLLWAIILSVLAVCLESIASVRAVYGPYLYAIEWFFTGLFTIEYIVRIMSVRKPTQYIFSFFGIIDLLSIIPTFLSLYFVGAQSLLVIRSIRILRVFRVLKLVRFVGEAQTLSTALKTSRRKITVFLFSVVVITLIMGALMFIVEGPQYGFTSIPRSVYWAIVTLTTVGYGDVSPQTPFGQFLAACLMVIGYAIIAVPTGIVSVELAHASRLQMNTRTCPSCAHEGHNLDATFCQYCGEKLTS